MGQPLQWNNESLWYSSRFAAALQLQQIDIQLRKDLEFHNLPPVVKQISMAYLNGVLTKVTQVESTVKLLEYQPSELEDDDVLTIFFISN